MKYIGLYTIRQDNGNLRHNYYYSDNYYTACRIMANLRRQVKLYDCAVILNPMHIYRAINNPAAAAAEVEGDFAYMQYFKGNRRPIVAYTADDFFARYRKIMDFVTTSKNAYLHGKISIVEFDTDLSVTFPADFIHRNGDFMPGTIARINIHYDLDDGYMCDCYPTTTVFPCRSILCWDFVV